jgi:hypothetical protein
MRARPLLEHVVHRAHRAILNRARAPRALGDRIEAHVRGDPIEPRAQRRTPLEALEALPGAHQRLLHGVISIDGGTQHAIAVPRERHPVGLQLGKIERLERGRGDRHQGGS